MGFLSFLTLSCTSKKTENDLLTEQIDNSIIELFQAHNFVVKKDKNGIINVNTKEEIAFENKLYFKDYTDSYLSRLDIKIKLTDGKEIYECFGDIADSKIDAVKQNLVNFNRNDFHVILNAFNDSNDQQITIEEWEIGNLKYKVFIGNFGIKSSVKFDIPENTFAQIKQIVKRQNLNDDTHWVRFFYSNLNGKPNSTEFLVDNELVPNGITEMESLDWEKLEDFYSLRHFMILKKIE